MHATIAVEHNIDSRYLNMVASNAAQLKRADCALEHAQTPFVFARLLWSLFMEIVAVALRGIGTVMLVMLVPVVHWIVR